MSKSICLTQAQVAELTELKNNPKTPATVQKRAEAILLLEAGSQCKDIAKQLRLIPKNIDSSKLKESIGQIFTNEIIQIERDFKNYISIDKIIFVPNSNENIEVKDIIDYPSDVNLSASFKLLNKNKKVSLLMFCLMEHW